jgi:methionyl-tRNA formyltransferase
VRVVFLGSGSFAIPSFEALVDAGHDVALLVTQPDKQKGRGRGVAPPPLKPVALTRGIPVLQPRRIREPEAQAAVAERRPDVQVVVAYGQILPKALVEAPRHGSVNVHASLLPRYRGAAPIQWAVANGDVETGVTTMRMDEGLDTGPILMQRVLAIGPQETAGELQPRLAALGAALLLETLQALEAGTLLPRPQDASAASLAPILEKQDGRIDWTASAARIGSRIRGFDPWPGSYTTWRGSRLAVWKAHPSDGAHDLAPGTLLGRDADAIAVACGGRSVLRVLEVQPEGRRRMPAAAFAAGARPEPGARFE